MYIWLGVYLMTSGEKKGYSSLAGVIITISSRIYSSCVRVIPIQPQMWCATYRPSYVIACEYKWMTKLINILKNNV